MNIYPVPNLRNPFLGVHFTKTVDSTIKIGPTAIPAFWRENYTFNQRFKPGEFVEIAFQEAKLFSTNAFGFRDLAFEEMHKYCRDYFISLAVKMVPSVDPKGFGEFTRPGIRAQLLDKGRLELVQDFVVEADKNSVHILNAVSPAFTCAFPFAEFVCKEYGLV
jgi:L-2-hydroxyglutarate oxidase LhgO